MLITTIADFYLIQRIKLRVMEYSNGCASVYVSYQDMNCEFVWLFSCLIRNKIEDNINRIRKLGENNYLLILCFVDFRSDQPSHKLKRVILSGKGRRL